MKNVLSFLIVLLTIAGCGDLRETKVVKTPTESRRFNAGCKLEVQRFKKIFEEPIDYDIECLGKSMDLFLELVETDRPGHLSRVALENYVQRNLEDFDPDYLKVIRAIFKINHLIFGDSVDYISPKSLKSIISFAKELNRQSVIIYPMFKSKEEIPYIQHDIQRTRVFKTIDDLKSSFLKIFVRERNGRLDSLDVVEMLESFFGDDHEDLEKVKSLLFIKRVFLGGEKAIITHRELQDLIIKAPQIGTVAFDLIRLKYVDLNQRSSFELLSSDLEQLEKILYFSAGVDQILFTIDDIILAVPQLTDSFPNFANYKKELIQIKMTLMTDRVWSTGEDLSGQENVTNDQFRVLFNHAKSIVKKGVFFHRMYEHYRVVMDSPLSINLNVNEVLLRFPAFGDSVKDFVRIVNNYRFYRGLDENGKSEPPYYTTAYRRNVHGAVETAMLEYAATLVMRRYGVETPGGVGGYGMEKIHIRNLLGILEDFLIDQDFLAPRRYYSSANTITLMSALFQYQSNGDSFVNANEIAEFGASILTGANVSKYFFEEIKKTCAVETANGQERFTDLNCYRQNFYPLLCKKYRSHFPRMASWLGLPSNCSNFTMTSENLEFLKTTEIAARTCVKFSDGSDVPVSEGDLMVIFVALLNIESTLTRWDKDMNNVMDPDEVEDSWAIYQSAIKGMARDIAPIAEKLAKPIFKYLVKYEKVPSTDDFPNFWQFVKFLVSFDKKAPATRKTIASVLKVIGETAGKPDPNDPPPYEEFDCECLRANNCTK
jgi:hypothetical protein